MFTQGFYGIYSMIFERIKNEDDQFRDNSDDDEDIPKFGKPHADWHIQCCLLY